MASKTVIPMDEGEGTGSEFIARLIESFDLAESLGLTQIGNIAAILTLGDGSQYKITITRPDAA